MGKIMQKIITERSAWGRNPIGSMILGLAAFSASDASAGEGSFGWIYTLDLQPKGTLEFEQRLQLTRKQAAGTYDLWRSRTELEYGLTDDIQIAGYLNAYSVNAAGNYTKPGMRKALFERIKGQATQGTAAGQWSARKAQLLAKQYKAKGGGYRG